MHTFLIYLIGALGLVILGHFAQRLLRRATKVQLPLIPANKASVKPLTPRQRGLLLLLMGMLISIPVFLYILLIHGNNLFALARHLAPGSAVVTYVTSGAQAGFAAGFFLILFASLITVSVVSERLPLVWRRQLGETPSGGRAVAIGIGSVLTLLALAAFAGFQSYVAFTPQGIIQNQFFAVTDHLTTYENLAHVDIRCQSITYRPKSNSPMHTKLLMTLDAYTKKGERIKVITKEDEEDLYVGPSSYSAPQLTPQAVRDMRQLLNKHHVLVTHTPCPDIDVYEPQMTPMQHEYYWALFGAAQQGAAPYRPY